MTAAARLFFPPGRALAGWWQQLTPWQPLALWVAQLVIHRVEALVRVTRVHRLDRFHSLVLRALIQSRDRTLHGIDLQLHLGPQLLYQVLRRLAAEQLAEVNPRGEWSATVIGLHALEQGEYPGSQHERRTFHFLDNRPGSGRPDQSISFLHLTDPTCLVDASDQALEFDPALLQVCLDQSREWKQRHGFSLSIQEVVALGPDSEPRSPGTEAAAPTTAVSAWQKIVLDRPAQLSAALILTEQNGGPEMIGFGVDQEGGGLLRTEPAFLIPSDSLSILPELGEEPSTELWRQAWRSWCLHHNLPAEEAEGCVLQRCGHRLQIATPGRLLERLRAIQSEALRGEVWLLAGTGRVRSTALVELAGIPG